MDVRQYLLQRRAWRVRKALPERKREEGRALLQALAAMLEQKGGGHVGRAVAAGKRQGE